MSSTASIKTPGVYIEELSLFPPSIAEVETAIPAFVGYTQSDSSGGNPTRITSLLEYTNAFGTATPQAGIEINVTEGGTSGPVVDFVANKGPVLKSYLYYQVQQFYANGGGPCYIVSVGKDTDGADDIKLKAGLDKLEAYDEPTLLVIPDAVFLADEKCYGLMNDALAQCNKLQDRFTIMDVKADPTSQKKDGEGNGVVDGDGNPVLNTPDDAFRNNINGDIDFAKYGAAYYPYLNANLSFDFSTEANVKIDAHNNPSGASVAGKTLADAKTINNDIYNKIKAALANQSITLPPSGAVAGLYAFVDNDRGVWKAPANVTVNNILGPAVNITDAMQAGLNVDTNAGKSINAIRYFTGKGTLVWGARTVAGNDNEWRYVPVRRFFIMVEESVKKGVYRYVFEPNDANTWVKVRAMIENFLTLQWRDGALQGAKPEQAFYVKVGLNQTMTQVDILEGRLIVEIGMAVVRPAEFIILRFAQMMMQS